MRTWIRTPRRLVCGKCAAPIAIGDLAQVLSRAEQTWRLHRCVSCADGEPPEDLPALPERIEVTPQPKRHFAKMARMAEDWKAKAAK